MLLLSISPDGSIPPVTYETCVENINPSSETIWTDSAKEGIKYTALRNHNRIVFEEMSSWTALTMHLGMKTTFYTKYM